jgi:hypothetical protein
VCAARAAGMAQRRSAPRHLLRGLLVLFALALLSLRARARSLPGANIVDEELTEEQVAYYRDIFEQYDEDKDQRISMEENLAQDKIIAEEQQKPFDEVGGCLLPRALALQPVFVCVCVCARALARPPWVGAEAGLKGVCYGLQ